MNICILTTTYPRHEQDYAGAFILGQARELATRGHTVHVIVPNDPETRTARDELREGIHIHRFHYWLPHRWERLCFGAGIPENFRRNRLLAIQLPFLILGFIIRALPFAHKSDIIHGHWTFAGLAAVLLGRLARKPVAITIYGADALASILGGLNRLIVRQADTVIAISEFTHDALASTVPDLDATIIPFGLNGEKVAPAAFDRTAFRQAYGFGADDHLVLSVGRLIERKGFHVLIEAMQNLSADLAAQLVIGGVGPEHDALQALVNRFGLQGRVHLLGYIDDDTLAQWYAAADVFVLPAVLDSSGDTEGLGMVLVEAMANGTPVIASDVGGITDIVIDGQTGLLAPPGDAMALAERIAVALANSELRAGLIKGAQQHVEQVFSWSVIGDQLTEGYEPLVESSTQH